MIELETIRDNAMRNLQMKGDLGGIIPLEQLEDIWSVFNERQQGILYMRFYENRDFKNIAKEFGITGDAVRRHCVTFLSYIKIDIKTDGFSSKLRKALGTRLHNALMRNGATSYPKLAHLLASSPNYHRKVRGISKENAKEILRVYHELGKLEKYENIHRRYSYIIGE